MNVRRRSMLDGMTTEIRHEQFTLALDSLRWLFVAIPLGGILPTLAPAAWPLAALALAASLPMLWLPARPAWLLPTALIVLTAAGGALWLVKPGLTL